MIDSIDEILSIPEETQTIEFKRLEGDHIVRKVIQTIVAMANAEGGLIILGVADTEDSKFKDLDRILGIDDNKELLDEILDKIREVRPTISGLSHKLCIAENGKTIAILEIPKATESFHSIKDEVWMRLHKSNKKLGPHEIVKLGYAKGFEKADKELVDLDFKLLETEYFDTWKKARDISGKDIKEILEKAGLASFAEGGVLKPTRAAVMLFAEFPTYLMETKCVVKVILLRGAIEQFGETPNYIGTPKFLNGPIIDVIKNSHEYVLNILKTGIEVQSGFRTKYKIPERAVKEAITNAVIHRDYYINRDIVIKIFEDRIEILSPGLFPYNITNKNIGYVRADKYRNDLLVKHLREFPNPP